MCGGRGRGGEVAVSLSVRGRGEVRWGGRWRGGEMVCVHGRMWEYKLGRHAFVRQDDGKASAPLDPSPAHP